MDESRAIQRPKDPNSLVSRDHADVVMSTMVRKTTKLWAALLLARDYHDEAFSSWCTLQNSKTLVELMQPLGVGLSQTFSKLLLVPIIRYFTMITRRKRTCVLKKCE